MSTRASFERYLLFGSGLGNFSEGAGAASCCSSWRWNGGGCCTSATAGWDAADAWQPGAATATTTAATNATHHDAHRSHSAPARRRHQRRVSASSKSSLSVSPPRRRGASSSPSGTSGTATRSGVVSMAVWVVPPPTAGSYIRTVLIWSRLSSPSALTRGRSLPVWSTRTHTASFNLTSVFIKKKSFENCVYFPVSEVINHAETKILTFVSAAGQRHELRGEGAIHSCLLYPFVPG